MLGCHIDEETRREAARGEERTLPHQILQIQYDKPRVKHNNNNNQESRAVQTNWAETVVEFIFVFLFQP